jgi:hypothetical protein
MPESGLESLHEARDIDAFQNEVGHHVASARYCPELAVLEVAGIGVMIVAARASKPWRRSIQNRNESGSRQDMQQ